MLHFARKGTVPIRGQSLGSDGAAGAEMIKRMGGKVIAQDEQTAEFFGMPGAATGELSPCAASSCCYRPLRSLAVRSNWSRMPAYDPSGLTTWTVKCSLSPSISTRQKWYW